MPFDFAAEFAPSNRTVWFRGRAIQICPTVVTYRPTGQKWEAITLFIPPGFAPSDILDALRCTAVGQGIMMADGRVAFALQDKQGDTLRLKLVFNVAVCDRHLFTGV